MDLVYVPHWNKLRTIADMLTLKMVEIEERYKNGVYKEFTVGELQSLIISLFDDGPNRKKLIQVIKR